MKGGAIAMPRPESELVTLADLVDKGIRFQVPIYQRLYVWGVDQVDTLLHDLWSAFLADAEVFYLGGTLVVEREDENGPVLELIDGQQRFTTLWMMSLAWGGPLQPFAWLAEGDHPRVGFSIRDDVDSFFRGVHAGGALDRSLLPEDFHPALIAAQARIGAFLLPDDRVKTKGASLLSDDRVEARDAFLTWLLERVEFVLTRVPADMDLNQLYEVINSRGQQLRHHDILKARLLAYLPPSERHRHAQLWEACSAMDTWADRALRKVSGLKVRDLVPPGGRPAHTLAGVRVLLGRLGAEHQEGDGDLDLATILATTDTGAAQASPAEELDTDESDEHRSILSFPLLLQHTLRIWLHDRGRADLPRIADKELLELFERHFLRHARADDVRSFVALLWEVRVVFDQHVVKWVRRGEDESLILHRLRVEAVEGQPRVRRTPVLESDAFALLQAMLYHSQQITTHYWLTPLLAYLHRHRPGPHGALAYLRHLDNHLLCRAGKGQLVEMSRQHLDDAPGRWRGFPLDCRVLDEPLGVGFPHYWFYKLEFLLWDQRDELGLTKRCGLSAQALREFRITARSSVEHISPQTPQDVDTNRVSVEVLDTFGNLALVSRSINSQYGNLPFNEKRQRFHNRNAARVDSLKMALVYRHTTWDDALAWEHQVEMVELVRAYLARDFSRS